ncbi:MAG: hypothetical protein ACKOZX_06330 [Gammaproteobacteria bacterium]
MVAGLAAVRRAQDRWFWWVMLSGVVFAIARATRWNYGVLAAGRYALKTFDAYDDRISLKIALAAMLAAALFGAVWALRAMEDIGRRLIVLGVGLQSSLLLVETLSLDEMMPAMLMSQPGRYLAEGSFLLLVFFGIRKLGSRR